MSEPTTAAGRGLLYDLGGVDETRDDIAAIEAEAAAAERTRLLDELVAAVRALVEHAPCVSMDSGPTVDRNAVLAAIERFR